jgi:hypothetical protein
VNCLRALSAAGGSSKRNGSNASGAGNAPPSRCGGSVGATRIVPCGTNVPSLNVNGFIAMRVSASAHGGEHRERAETGATYGRRRSACAWTRAGTSRAYAS